jgi:uncharacterized protein with ParB-like and HNH nuclease domain
MTKDDDVQLIQGDVRSVLQLFQGAHYQIEFYQREYAWQVQNLQELLDDFTRSFFSEYKESHSNSQVATYRAYFLGPIVTHREGAVKFLVDGQQRMTTLSLLLAHLSHVADEDQKSLLQSLVFSNSFGKKSFTIDVPERQAVMNAIFNGTDFDMATADPSSINIWARYLDIGKLFEGEDFEGTALRYFIDWLLHRVVLVDIGTKDRAMALEIFESMNDRGLQLTNMDMLKSFLLSNIGTPEEIREAQDVWRSIVQSLTDNQKNGDSDFMKTLLRAKFAETVRERNKGAVSKDFEEIGTGFHKWLRDDSNRELVGLRNPSDFQRFLREDMAVLSARYLHLLTVAKRPTYGWEHVFFNSYNNFTLQFIVILAAVRVQDTFEEFQTKTQLISRYLDLVIARRMVNYKIFGYSPMYFQMFGLAKELRNRDIKEIREILSKKIHDLQESFDGIDNWSLNLGNKPNMYYMLSRMTSWLEEQPIEEGKQVPDSWPAWDTYFARNLSDPWEVEHIWANHYERHTAEFSSDSAFQEARNRFGALLLLPKSVNASLSDLSVQEKVPVYLKQNLLARLANSESMQNDPRLKAKVSKLSTAAEAIGGEMDEAQIARRTAFYKSLCLEIWNPVNLGFSIAH